MKLSIEPLSGTTVGKLNSGAVTQEIGVEGGDGVLRMRFRVGYGVNGARVDESGEFTSQ